MSLYHVFYKFFKQNLKLSSDYLKNTKQTQINLLHKEFSKLSFLKKQRHEEGGYILPLAKVRVVDTIILGHPQHSHNTSLYYNPLHSSKIGKNFTPSLDLREIGKNILPIVLQFSITVVFFTFWYVDNVGNKH